jgi:hypothetical protein
MAVTRVPAANWYVGLKADTKPTAGVPEGSRFYERDTGDEFIWDGTAWGRLHTKPVTVYTATGTGALSLATSESGRFQFVQASVKFNSLPVTSQDVTLTLDALGGAAYDAILRRLNPSLGTGTGDTVFLGDPDEIYESGDQLTLAYTNTDGRTFGARIVVRPL